MLVIKLDDVQMTLDMVVMVQPARQEHVILTLVQVINVSSNYGTWRPRVKFWVVGFGLPSYCHHFVVVNSVVTSGGNAQFIVCQCLQGCNIIVAAQLHGYSATIQRLSEIIREQFPFVSATARDLVCIKPDVRTCL